MPNDNNGTPKGVTQKDRLVYIEPNEFAGYYKVNNVNNQTETELSWNPEDLSISVDLQVVIPRREDKGQYSYLMHLDGSSVNASSNSVLGRYVSYMGGVPINNREDSQSLLTSNYTNISYQEISGLHKVIDKESLGIDSIDINFDAHFFPIVTMKMTDVRGYSLFMPSEYEFDTSMTDKPQDSASSFFKALFHFPYPRFLLSIKGFYGSKVTFQLAVNDFRSEFQSETGNYGVTIQFIGYIYGLYTDLPLNLVMAAPFYNREYWDNKCSDGTFKYVEDNGNNGGEIDTYPVFLSKIEGKEVDNDVLSTLDKTDEYFKRKKQKEQLDRIINLTKQICTYELTEKTLQNQCRKVSERMSFTWGVSLDGSGNTTFYLNKPLVETYYKALREYKAEYGDTDIKDNPIIDIKEIDVNDTDAKNVTSKELYKKTGVAIKTYFTEKKSTGETDNTKWIIGDNSGFQEKADNELKDCDLFKVDSNLKLSSMNSIINIPFDGGFALLLDFGTFNTILQTKITELNNQNTADESAIANELKIAYKNVIGFTPTVENFYRMLFAHIDTFMNYFNVKILNGVRDDVDANKRTAKYLGLSLDETDIPKTTAGNNQHNADNQEIYPFPAYYVKKHKNGEVNVAEYPGLAENKEIKNIREVKAVEEIIGGIKELSTAFKPYVNADSEGVSELSNQSVESVFSKLSILYDTKNPWDDLQLSGTNDEEDLQKIMYYFIYLLFADKYIGTNVNSGLLKNKVNEDYYNRLIELLLKSKSFSNTFIKTLEKYQRYDIYNLVKNDKKPKGYNLKIYETEHSIKIGDNDSIILKIDNNIFNMPNNSLDYPLNSTKKEYFGITGYGLLNSSDEQYCKEYNNKLLSISEGSEYFGYNIEAGKPKTDAFVNDFYKCYSVSMPREKLYEKKFEINDSGETVGNTQPIATIREDANRNYIYYIKNSKGDLIEEKYKIEKNDLNNYFTDYYKSDSYSDNIATVNFVGRKTGKILSPFGTTYDGYPAVNLFSGIKSWKKNGVEIFSFNGTGGTYTEEAIDDIDDYVPLFASKRCQCKNNEDIPQILTFAVYFLATLSGYGSLSKLVDLIKQKDSISQPCRLVDILYLGGLLYFKNEVYKDRIDYKTRELITSDGKLGGGLLLDDDVSTFTILKQIELDLSDKIFESISYDLIDKFLHWVNGGLINMFHKLVHGDVEFEGYMSQNSFNKDTTVTVLGYSTGSECELWLRKLTYSYTHLIILREHKSYLTFCISQYELNSFLRLFKEKLSKQNNVDDSLITTESTSIATEYNETNEQRRAIYYLLKNLYDKWLCGYRSDEFELCSPDEDLKRRRERFCGIESNDSNNNINIKRTEYNNFVYVDQFFNDISSTYIMNAEEIASVIKDVHNGNKNIDIYSFMSYMAEKNNLMLMALPVYNNMYNAKSIASVFTPNTLYNLDNYDNHCDIGTTYVVMHVDEVSHVPNVNNTDYNRDYPDIADVAYNQGAVDLHLFSKKDKNDESLTTLNYNINAFAVTYSKQNQMYFKRVNVSMDNPRITDESIKNILMISDAGGQGDTNQPVGIGQNIYSIYSNRSYTCSVEMMGCANIMPLMYFQLNNIPMFRGLYMIINVKHAIKAGDMTTTFTGVRISRNSQPDITGFLFNSSLFNKLEGKYQTYEAYKAKCLDGVDLDENLSEHFKLSDFIKSSTAESQFICNIPNSKQKENLKRLCENILEPIYSAWKNEHPNDGIYISSGFRSVLLNEAVGGSSTSDHCDGNAADIKPLNSELINDFKEFVYNLLKNGNIAFGQYINEKTTGPGWVHISNPTKLHPNEQGAKDRYLKYCGSKPYIDISGGYSNC